MMDGVFYEKKSDLHSSSSRLCTYARVRRGPANGAAEAFGKADPAACGGKFRLCARALEVHLDEIAQAAQTCLSELGEDAPVRVRLGKELFPTREYETFALPAGVYESLRVTIGEGEGHNWWCVVFPSICLTASMDELELAAQTAGFSDGEIRLITGADEGFVLKFRALELLQRLKALLEK